MTPLHEYRQEHNVQTPQEMRAAMHAARYSRRQLSCILSRCFTHAEHAGLNGEDTMTLIAFEAVCALEREMEVRLRYIETHWPAPLVIVPPVTITEFKK